MQQSLQTHTAIGWEWDFSISHSEWTAICPFISFVLTAQENLLHALKVCAMRAMLQSKLLQ